MTNGNNNIQIGHHSSTVNFTLPCHAQRAS